MQNSRADDAQAIKSMPSNSPAKPSLQVKNLSCIRGDRTLFSELNFELDSRQCLHVIGANGSGKTSLLRIIAGLTNVQSGTLLWQSKATKANEEYFRDSIYIGHTDGLKNELTAAENLSFYQQLDGLSQCDARVDQNLAHLGILDCADLTANCLSFGQRRRLAFARLLSGNFKLWILDEPFTGVDQGGRKLIEQTCVQHLQADGLILLTNHRSLKNSELTPFLAEFQLSHYVNETC